MECLKSEFINMNIFDFNFDVNKGFHVGDEAAHILSQSISALLSFLSSLKQQFFQIKKIN
jgi:hypothetical protein